MRVLRNMVIIMLVVMIVTLLGQVLMTNGVNVKELPRTVIKYIKGYGKQDEQELEVDNVEVINEGYENGVYKIYVMERVEDMAGVNYVIQRRMRAYYKLVTEALEREKRKYDGSSVVQVWVGDREWSMGFEYSYDRKESLEWHVGRRFFIEHIRYKGWDVLNNSDGFWLDDDVKRGLTEDISERVNWKKHRR